jgi:hypothetical protein
MRRFLGAVGMAGCGLVLGGCYAQTEPASDVGSTSATFNAHGFTNGKQGQAFFQYSTAKNALGTGYGKPWTDVILSHRPGRDGFRDGLAVGCTSRLINSSA